MSGLYLLDTNIISGMMRLPESDAAALYRSRIQAVGDVQIATSAIVLFELKFGLQRMPSVRLQRNFDRQMARIPVLPLDSEVADAYARLRHRLESQGQPIGPRDTLIAAHALALKAVLVSADAEFTRVPGLTVENWLS